MPAARAKTTDRMARAFMDGVSNNDVCIGNAPPELIAKAAAAALWLTTEGARIIKKTEKEVVCKKAGMELATDIARARWRKDKDAVVAESGYFAYSFTAARNGWRLSGCRMLWTARTDLRSYLLLFGDFSHSPMRGIMPDFYLRDLTPEEIKESGLREGAVLSVSSAKMKQMGRAYMHKTQKREKNMRAILAEWSATPVGEMTNRLKAKPEKNAWVISLGKKRG